MSINLTLIGQMITFALLVWFTEKYVWSYLLGVLEERRKKIAEGLAAAERGQEEIKLAEKKAKSILKEAKEQSSEIVGAAQKRANLLVEDAKDQAKKEGERLLEAAKAQIEQELLQARESLRKEVSSLALRAAEQILKEEIDKAKHQDILSKAADQLG
ncbi:F0F1 ATP synthase subunit B [Methylomonas sp. MED-D]|uniref:ATP synthase subunit b n=1 Tax=Methylomonas koyamae TaxID=702114 RepID=A0A177NNR8_9GAMM|nr:MULTISPECIES: F0F1 ATP synthase subunit B [Methylomonas]NJA04679.1 F0F1 ATP synthase subunit B [Methylococcaceae bacterium WWC4]MDT4332842.1 F0F1 ATP synthase subunit B [Methylomonas sp. MV1]OAI18993.1 F0F1 ATP synthase subunit B [Methylomonas koyamae]OHX34220.1 F0F1 ATP synthase subunit B [Methylomonas sp. LWB]WGS86070.1 F0F1 ATP synthase subunit B [Methylomonas sp. UP202]